MALLKKNIKFPLEMKNGKNVRTLEELKENFDVERILNYYFNGKLEIWLTNRYYSSELKLLKELEGIDEKEVPQKLCRIFEQKFSDSDNYIAEALIEVRKKIDTLKQFTGDLDILEKIDFVATTQTELEGIIKKENQIHKIFLLGEEFSIDDKNEGIEYIGINQPMVRLLANEKFNAQKIFFKNVVLTADSEIKINTRNDLAKLNKVDDMVKVFRGFEKLKKIQEIDKLIYQKPYGGLVIHKVLMGEKISLVGHENKYILVVEPDGNKATIVYHSQFSDSEFVSDWIPLQIDKGEDGEILYFYKGGYYEKGIKLRRLDKVGYKGEIIIRDFDEKIHGVNRIDIYGNKVYILTTQNSVWGFYNYRFWSYDITTGKEVEQGDLDFNHFEDFSNCFIFYKGKYYFYDVEKNCLNSNENQQIKLDIVAEASISQPIICRDKIISTDLEETGYLWIFDFNTGKTIKKFNAHNQSVELIKEFGDTFITMTQNGEIKIWDSNNLTLISSIQLPPKQICDSNYHHWVMDIDITGENMAVLYDGKVFVYSN